MSARFELPPPTATAAQRPPSSSTQASRFEFFAGALRRLFFQRMSADMNKTRNPDRKKIRRPLLPLMTRRRFVKTAGAATTAVAVGFGTTSVGAEERQRVNENGAVAKALNYVHNAQSVDAAVRFSNRYCNNCALYAGGSDEEWANCSVFPGKVVAGRGWCSAWAPKQIAKSQTE